MVDDDKTIFLRTKNYLGVITHKTNLNHITRINPHSFGSCSFSENALGMHYLVVVFMSLTCMFESLMFNHKIKPFSWFNTKKVPFSGITNAEPIATLQHKEGSPESR